MCGFVTVFFFIKGEVHFPTSNIQNLVGGDMIMPPMTVRSTSIALLFFYVTNGII
jgi:hypothetical protein